MEISQLCNSALIAFYGRTEVKIENAINNESWKEVKELGEKQKLYHTEILKRMN